VELNKIYFVIFKFLYELLCIYQFSTDQFYTKKHRQATPTKKYTKICDIFCLLHVSTYVELNKICFIGIQLFFLAQTSSDNTANYLVNFMPSDDINTL